MKNNNRGGEGGLNKEGRLINILPLKRGGAYQREGDFLKGAMILRLQCLDFKYRQNKVEYSLINQQECFIKFKTLGATWCLKPY